jgi:hypothetical protein
VSHDEGRRRAQERERAQQLLHERELAERQAVEREALRRARERQSTVDVRAPRTAARARPYPPRHSESRWLPSEALLGGLLFVFGLTIAVLILTGEVRLGFAP